MTAEFSPPDMRLFRNVSLFEVEFSDQKKKFEVTPEKQVVDYSKFLNWSNKHDEIPSINIPHTDLHSDY